MAARIKVSGSIIIVAATLHQARKLWEEIVGDGASLIEAREIRISVCPAAGAKTRKAR
jgi:hypothetical protein